MMHHSFVFGLGAIALLLRLAAAAAISPVTVKGAKLYTEDGEQFFLKGVAYSRGVSSTIDALADNDQCQIDAGLMTAIGVNTVRVYYVDTASNHDGCMEAFASHGIYVWLDMTTPLTAIDRTDPEYTMAMYNGFTAVIDAFAKYDNLLSFTAGNEVLNTIDGDTVDLAPYVKAIVRDVRAFRDARGYRKIPISYTAADDSALVLSEMDYFACGDQDDTIEMFGMNVYSWCGNDSSYYQSGYSQVYTQFQHTNIPVVFSEVGCNLDGPRTFAEVAAILGPVFPATFSGVIVYEWLEETNDFGLVKYPNSKGTGFPATLSDYNALAKVYSTASPVSTAMSDYTVSYQSHGTVWSCIPGLVLTLLQPTNSPPACPKSKSSWDLSASVPLPTIARLEVSTISASTTYTTPSPAASTKAGSGSAATLAGGSGGAPTDVSDQQDSQASLSTGAIAGIAVGGAAIGILAAIAAFFLLRRRRRKNSKNSGKSSVSGYDSAPGTTSEDAAGYNKAELPANATEGAVRGELDASIPVHEVENKPVVGELDHYAADKERRQRRSVYEMDGSRPEVQELESRQPPRDPPGFRAPRGMEEDDLYT